MTILPGVLQPREYDRLFDNSPDTGHPDCICSRCLSQIKEYECAIRMWTTNAIGKVDKESKEYRYCESCMSGIPYFYCEAELSTDFKCSKQCQDCHHERH